MLHRCCMLATCKRLPVRIAPCPTMVAHAQVIETSEEEAYVAVAKFVGELRDGDQVRHSRGTPRRLQRGGEPAPPLTHAIAMLRRAPLPRSASNAITSAT